MARLSLFFFSAIPIFPTWGILSQRLSCEVVLGSGYVAVLATHLPRVFLVFFVLLVVHFLNFG